MTVEGWQLGPLQLSTINYQLSIKMRIIATIPHPKIKISVFQMNQKYLLKMEAGPYEQTYKIYEDEINSMEQLHAICNEEFMNTVIQRFEQMHHDFENSLKQFGQ